jgi:hypothetical protein
MITYKQKYRESRFLIYRIAMIVMASFTVYAATATTLISQNLAQLSENAESAFVIQISDLSATTTETGSYDEVTGTVIEPVFGNVQTSQVISWKQFRFGRAQALPGMPQYKVGQEYLIFLSGKGIKTGYQSPMGMGQGVFTIRRNPKTSAAVARNAFGNNTLSAGLDIGAAARDMVVIDPKARSLTPAERQAEIENLKLKLRGAPQNSLGVIKRAARFFHSQKERGQKPSRDYRTTQPVRLLH